MKKLILIAGLLVGSMVSEAQATKPVTESGMKRAGLGGSTQEERDYMTAATKADSQKRLETIRKYRAAKKEEPGLALKSFLEQSKDSVPLVKAPLAQKPSLAENGPGKKERRSIESIDAKETYIAPAVPKDLNKDVEFVDQTKQLPLATKKVKNEVETAETPRPKKAESVNIKTLEEVEAKEVFVKPAVPKDLEKDVKVVDQTKQLPLATKKVKNEVETAETPKPKQAEGVKVIIEDQTREHSPRISSKPGFLNED